MFLQQGRNSLNLIGYSSASNDVLLDEADCSDFEWDGISLITLKVS